MHRGCVNNFPISTKIARERSAWSPIDSKSDGLLRARDFDSVCANAARGTVAVPQPNDTIRTIERTNIAASAQFESGKLREPRGPSPKAIVPGPPTETDLLLCRLLPNKTAEERICSASRCARPACVAC